MTDQDAMNEIERLTFSAAQSFINEIKDDQLITCLPEYSTLSEEEIEEFKEIISDERPERVIIVEHTNMFDSNLRMAEDDLPVIHFHIPVPTIENLQLMMEGKAPRDSEGEPLNLHHWHREAEGPLIAIHQSLHPLKRNKI